VPQAVKPRASAKNRRGRARTLGSSLAFEDARSKSRHSSSLEQRSCAMREATAATVVVAEYAEACLEQHEKHPDSFFKIERSHLAFGGAVRLQLQRPRHLRTARIKIGSGSL